MSSHHLKDDASVEENEYAHERWCNDLAANFLCVFVLDRFGDFVSDQVIPPFYIIYCRLTPALLTQVVAPVRETVSQTLAALLLHMPRRSVTHVHTILLQMIQQDFEIPKTVNKSTKGDPEKTHIWEIRHAGLLGIKYEVAVRNDLFDTGAVKQEGNQFNESGKDVLRGVVDAAVLGWVFKYLCRP